MGMVWYGMMWYKEGTERCFRSCRCKIIEVWMVIEKVGNKMSEVES
jgi:hypothetical protein